MAENTQNTPVYTPSKYFQRDNIVKVVPKSGYVSVIDNSPEQFSADDCAALNNYDLQPDGARRRPPYSLFMDLINVLPTGYTIAKFCEKNFTDKTTNTDTVIYLVLAYKDDNSKSKLYCSHYYAPSDGSSGSVVYDNAWTSEAIGSWHSQWTLITERYKTPIVAEEPIDETVQFGHPQSNVLFTLDTRFNKSLNYFKGWYVIDTNNNICGIIKTSKWILTPYIGCWITIDVDSGADLTRAGICRFQVNSEARNSLYGLKDISFNIGQENTIRIFGKDKNNKIIRPFWFGFLQERLQFGGFIPDQSSLTYSGGATNWITKTELLGSYSLRKTDSVQVKVFNVLIGGSDHHWNIQISTDGATWSTLYDNTTTGYPSPIDFYWAGIKIEVNFSLIGIHAGTNYAYFNIIASADQRKWNGFWFDYTSPLIPDKKSYYLSEHLAMYNITYPTENLGFYYAVDMSDATAVSNVTKPNRAYSLAIEFDGYQTFFITNAVTVENADISKHDILLKIYMVIKPWYNRRISAHLIFYNDFEDAEFPVHTSHLEEIPSTFLLDDSIPGYYSADVWGLVTSGGNTHIPFPNVPIMTYASETSANDLIRNFATGTTLQAYLNNFYWSDVNIAPYVAEKVNNTFVGANCNYNIDASWDDLSKKVLGHGSQYIVVSQLQNGVTPCPDIFCTERMRQYSIGFPLIAVVAVIADQFMVFTSYDMKHLELNDVQGCVIRDIATFENKGLVSRAGLVKALEPIYVESGQPTTPLESTFKGIYWLSSKTIYGVGTNRPQDILTIKDENDRVIKKLWQEEYQSLDKTVMFGTYNVNNDQIIFLCKVPSGNDSPIFEYQLRIYQIPYERWIIYTFPDTPLGFVMSIDGEIYFYTDTKIFKTEPLNTTIWRDGQDVNTLAGGVEIPRRIDIILNHNNIQVMKVPDSFEINYDAVLSDTSQTVQEHVNVQDEDGNQIFDRDFDLVKPTEMKKDYEKLGYDIRTRAVYYRISFTSVDDTYLKSYKLNQFKSAAFLTAGTLTKG